jgi:hypothetical protein
MDLLRKLAEVSDETIQDDETLISWYKEKYSTEPDYSVIIESLARTPAERQALLRGYFEPNEKEKEEGIKTPSKAHHAIARLISNGYIKIVVTTNFDKLLEQALDGIGVSYSVFSTPEQMSGAIPLRHAGPTIIKVHGDYRSDRFKNTDRELSQYEKPINKTLDEVFDQYGLIVCGWSSDYDHALRAAVERTMNRRYSTYWTHISELSEKALSLIRHRDASTIKISGADQFFEELSEKVQSLEDIDAAHPMSEKIAVATVKRYLPDPLAQIKLDDLIRMETGNVVEEIQREEFSASSYLRKGILPYDEKERFDKYWTICSKLLKMLCVLAHWGEERHADLIVKTVQRISLALPENSGSYNPHFAYAQLCPALLLFYATGITRIAADRYDLFTKFSSFTYSDGEVKNVPFIAFMLPGRVLRGLKLPSLQGQFPYYYDYPSPPRQETTDHFLYLLRELLREHIPDEKMYTDSSALFEYLKIISIFYESSKHDSCSTLLNAYLPLIFFAKGNYDSTRQDILCLPEILAEKINRELERNGSRWQAMVDGLCGSDAGKLKEIMASLIEQEKRLISYPALCKKIFLN